MITAWLILRTITITNVMRVRIPMGHHHHRHPKQTTQSFFPTLTEKQTIEWKKLINDGFEFMQRKIASGEFKNLSPLDGNYICYKYVEIISDDPVLKQFAIQLAQGMSAWADHVRKVEQIKIKRKIDEEILKARAFTLFKIAAIGCAAAFVAPLGAPLIASLGASQAVGLGVATALTSAATDAAAQGVGVGLGVQEKFSVTEVVENAICGGFGAYAGAVGTGAVGRAAAAGAANLGCQAVELAAGKQKKFDPKALGTQVLISLVSSAVTKAMTPVNDVIRNVEPIKNIGANNVLLVTDNLAHTAANTAVNKAVNGGPLNLEESLMQTIASTVGYKLGNFVKERIAQKPNISLQELRSDVVQELENELTKNLQIDFDENLIDKAFIKNPNVIDQVIKLIDEVDRTLAAIKSAPPEPQISPKAKDQVKAVEIAKPNVEQKPNPKADEILTNQLEEIADKNNQSVKQTPIGFNLNLLEKLLDNTVAGLVIDQASSIYTAVKGNEEERSLTQKQLVAGVAAGAVLGKLASPIAKMLSGKAEEVSPKVFNGLRLFKNESGPTLNVSKEVLEYKANGTEIKVGEDNFYKSAKLLSEHDYTIPGALGEKIADTFVGARYKTYELTEDFIFFRAGILAKPKSVYLSFDKPIGELQVRIDKAIRPVWPNGGFSKVEHGFTFKLPKGTRVYVGDAGNQGDIFIGGTNQIVIEEPTLEALELLETYELKREIVWENQIKIAQP